MFQNDRGWEQQVRIAGYKIHQMRYKYFCTDNTRDKWKNKKLKIMSWKKRFDKIRNKNIWKWIKAHIWIINQNSAIIEYIKYIYALKNSNIYGYIKTGICLN